MSALFTQDDLIYAYTRAQAIEDGQQVKLEGKLAEMARELYKFPVYLTNGVYSLVEQAVSNKGRCNDQEGVIWDILWMSRKYAQRVSTDTSRFVVIITGTGRKRNHEMFIQCGPTDIDDPAPALTIMLPEEM